MMLNVSGHWAGSSLKYAVGANSFGLSNKNAQKDDWRMKIKGRGPR